MKAIDVTGKRYGRLIVVERFVKEGKGTRKITAYRCLCDCGNETSADYSNLYTGTTKSCGCIRTEVLKRRKKDDKAVRITEMLGYYKRNAKLRMVSWELERSDFEAIVRSSCKYCGHHDPVRFVGVDRVDNSLGYTKENCVSCCRWCNWGKNERTLEEFEEWIRRLHAKLILHVR
jgi:hypothetical protein